MTDTHRCLNKPHVGRMVQQADTYLVIEDCT
jgi:hypothetical protein